MPHLFSNPNWRSLLTTIALTREDDPAPRRAAADLLHSVGDPLRAAYIRACCPEAPGEKTSGGLPSGEYALAGGWVPHGELMFHWRRGFVTRVHGPLAALRRELPVLIAREPLYQTSTGPLAVSVSDRAAFRAPQSGDDALWAWGHSPDAPDDTRAVAYSGPLLPTELFELIPWPPMFDSAHTAAVALSAALLAEAQERLGQMM